MPISGFVFAFFDRFHWAHLDDDFFLVNIFILRSFFICLPCVEILLHPFDVFLKGWHDVDQVGEERHWDKANEAWLRLGNVSCCSVAEHADGKSLLFFKITLLEELFEKKVGPVMNQFKVSAGNTHITRVKAVFENELLVLEEMSFILWVG